MEETSMSDTKKLSVERFKKFVLKTVQENLSNIHPEEDSKMISKIMVTYEKAVKQNEN